MVFAVWGTAEFSLSGEREICVLKKEKPTSLLVISSVSLGKPRCRKERSHGVSHRTAIHHDSDVYKWFPVQQQSSKIDRPAWLQSLLQWWTWPAFWTCCGFLVWWYRSGSNLAVSNSSCSQYWMTPHLDLFRWPAWKERLPSFRLPRGQILIRRSEISN